MLNRKYNLKLDLQFRCNNSNMEFNQFDKNTSDFFMQINRSGKEIDLSKALVTLMVIKPNGNVDSQFLEVGKDGVYANLKPSLKNVPGDYQCKAIVTIKDETVIPDQVFTYTVNEDKFLTAFNQNMTSNDDYALVTDILGRLSTIETDEQQRQINEAERILSEEARKVAENTRVEAELTREHNDADREKAEAVRGTNENNRVKAEKLRSTNEDERVGAESSRVEAENLRVEAEKLRNDNYNFMTEDESRRRSNEDLRVKAEAERVKVEANRVTEESKRRTVETARVKAETLRAGAEVKRVEAETSRVEAEKVRSSRYEALIGEAEKSVQNFNSYASSAKLEEVERSNNENSRVEAEKLRSTNESTRINDEKVRVKNEQLRVEKEATRNNVFDAKVVEVNSKINEVNTAKNTMVDDTKKAIDKMTNDFNSLSASQQQDAEVVLARDGEESLNARLERDLFIGDKSLKQEVIDLGGLKESQDMAYTTDKGYLVCKETKNGTIKDLKISGKSLINLSSVKDMEVVGTGSGSQSVHNKLIKPLNKDNVYTIVIKVPTSLQDANCMLGVYDASGNGRIQLFSGTELFNAKGNTLVKSFKLLSNSDVDVVTVRLIINNTSNTYTLNDVIILEGDHTQSPPNSYFEGIASVGNGVDKIEVSTVKADGNLFVDELEVGGMNDNTGEPVTNVNLLRSPNYIRVDNVSTYSLLWSSTADAPYNEQACVLQYDKDKNYIKKAFYDGKCKNFTPDNNCCYIKFRIHKGGHTVYFGKCATQYTPCKQDKKPILFKDADGTWKPISELRGLDTVCDTIELHTDGKYYYHQRTNKTTLNELSAINLCSNMQVEGYLTVQMTIGDYVKSMGIGTIMSEKYKVGIDKAELSEGIYCKDNYLGYSTIAIRILNSKANTVEAFKQYLQANNDTLIYQLEKEKIFEVNPLFLEAFEGETMVSVNSGVINAPMEFKLTSTITNLMRNLQLRVANLENDIYKSQELQDIMLLENDLRLMDLEFALLESMPMKLNLRSDVMFSRGVTEFEFLKKRIESGSHTDEYLEKCINKYKKAGRLTDEEYDILYDMIYPPVYDVLAEK